MVYGCRRRVGEVARSLYGWEARRARVNGRQPLDSAHTLSRLFRHRRICGHAGKHAWVRRRAVPERTPVVLAPTPTRRPGKRARTRACTPSRPGTPKLPLRRPRTSSPKYRSHPRTRAASPSDKSARLVGSLGGAERVGEGPEVSFAHADLACPADDEGKGGENVAYCRARAVRHAAHRRSRGARVLRICTG